MNKFDITCKKCGGEASIRDYPNDAKTGKIAQCSKCGTMEEVK